jgi:predicted nuclease of predicted toxin-antitoxin system
MNLLFDQNISHRLIRLISDIFPEAKQVRELGIENYSDKKIWEFAKENNYIIVTFDSDFYNFSMVWGHPPKIVLLRTFNQTTSNIENLIRNYQKAINDFHLDHELACLEIIN